MTRVLFTVPPLLGHLYPALSVADALAAQGHEVAWAVEAGTLDAELTAARRVYPLPRDTAPANDDPRDRPVRGLESLRLLIEDYAVPMAHRVLPALEAAVRDFQPDVLAVDHQMPAGAIVARRLGLRWLSLATTPASTLRLTAPVQAWADAQHRALQAAWLPAQAIAAWPDLSPHGVIVFSVEALAGPAAERVPARYHFVGPAAPSGRREIAFPWHWLRDDRRRVLVTLGTVSRDRDPRFFEVMLEAFAALPQVQAVFVASAELAAQAPANVLVREQVPQPALLDRVDAVVCHAGHNTVCEALLRGLPLVVSPIRDDQPMIARQVVDAGAAIFLRHGKVTVAAAREAIERLLDTPSLADAARRLATTLRAAPGRQAAAALLAGQA